MTSPRPLTRTQRYALGELRFYSRRTPRDIGVRSDVLWRLEERGLVQRNLHEEWSITSAGIALLRDLDNSVEN